MAQPHNPAGPSTPAGNTMSVPRSVSGGRTRNVINIAQPGAETTKALTAVNSTSSAPSSATDGFANFRRQRYLHVQLVATSDHSNDTATFVLWGYNSMSGQWGRLQMFDHENSGGFEKYQFTITNSDKDGKYWIVDIAGVERVFLQCTAYTDGDTDNDFTVDAWLGVNSF